jgi:prepilin-type N-terminal cleavage/methylation domain-containing protein
MRTRCTAQPFVQSECFEEGFSLIEMLVVVAVMGIILAFAVPNLIKSRNSANAASAISSLRTISTAQQLYRNRFSTYGTLSQLVPEGTLDTNLGAGYKSGYYFTVVVVSTDPVSFQCNADPFETVAILPHFFVDDTNVIRVKVGAPADASSTGIQ